jgi:DNA adenine methylase
MTAPRRFGLKLYRYNFVTEDFEKLAERLGSLQGKFVLSLNDVPEVRKIFREFHIKHVETPYTAQKKSGRRYSEVFITNFTP